jgi:hypothetical protein
MLYPIELRARCVQWPVLFAGPFDSRRNLADAGKLAQAIPGLAMTHYLATAPYCFTWNFPLASGGCRRMRFRTECLRGLVPAKLLILVGKAAKKSNINWGA